MGRKGNVYSEGRVRMGKGMRLYMAKFGMRKLMGSSKGKRKTKENNLFFGFFGERGDFTRGWKREKGKKNKNVER